ncbi:MAG: hypothetical protein ABUL71_04570, partial [Gemmatimonadota bacterium]
DESEESMNSKQLISSVIVAAALAGTGGAFAATSLDRPATVVPSRMTAGALHDAMRKLWEDHVTWTRLYIISAVAGQPDAKPALDRLMQNQADIGNAVAEYYGRPAGDQLTTLLKSHIATAGELVGAAKAGDQAKTADAKTRWYANADQIAEFLAKANPKHWQAATLKAAMKTHLDQTLDEATHRIQGNYAADILDYDHIVAHILGLADVLSSGIVAQFPAKFAAKGTR